MSRKSPAQRLLGPFRRRLLVDAYEPWSWLKTRGLPTVEGALLIGSPFSPVVYAAKRLRERGVPYVVDVGDPWVLTALSAPAAGLALRRARALERLTWANARGAVVTTEEQAARLRSLFGSLSVLVRPNGADRLATSERRPRKSSSEHILRLVHFGSYDLVREDIRPFLRSLAQSRLWREIVFDQYGSDWSGVLRTAISGVCIRVLDPLPWKEASRLAMAYDAAVAIGPRDGSQLPSKAVAYGGLPIPRIAFSSLADSALHRYSAGKPTWLTVGARDPDIHHLVLHHIRANRADIEYELPSSEEWPAVAAEVEKYVVGTLWG